jgi:hypothetical protein
MDNGQHSNGDESVWFSFLAAGLALFAALKYPSVAMGFVLILMIGWFVWSLWKITADRFN